MSITHNIFTSYMEVPRSESTERYMDELRALGYSVEKAMYSGDFILYSRGKFCAETNFQFHNSYADEYLNKVTPEEFLRMAKEFEG